jgi:hypothetical protein
MTRASEFDRALGLHGVEVSDDEEDRRCRERERDRRRDGEAKNESRWSVAARDARGRLDVQARHAYFLPIGTTSLTASTGLTPITGWVTLSTVFPTSSTIGRAGVLDDASDGRRRRRRDRRRRRWRRRLWAGWRRCLLPRARPFDGRRLDR